MKKVAPEQVSQFNADFVKIFTSGLGLGLVVLGYSYTNTFFRSFGLSLFQLDMAWIDILFRGVALFQDWRVAAIFSATILTGSVIFSSRNLVGATAKVVIISFTVFGFVIAATWGGQVLGYQHARSIWEGGAGKVAFCQLNSDHKQLSDLASGINELSLQQRIRLVYQSKDHTFLAPVYQTVREGQRTGEAYVIPTSAISFCRVIGS